MDITIKNGTCLTTNYIHISKFSHLGSHTRLNRLQFQSKAFWGQKFSSHTQRTQRALGAGRQRDHWPLIERVAGEEQLNWH